MSRVDRGNTLHTIDPSLGKEFSEDYSDRSGTRGATRRSNHTNNGCATLVEAIRLMTKVARSEEKSTAWAVEVSRAVKLCLVPHP